VFTPRRNQPERIVGHGGRDHEHLDDVAAGAVRAEAALVERLTVLAGSGSIGPVSTSPLIQCKYRFSFGEPTAGGGWRAKLCRSYARLPWKDVEREFRSADSSTEFAQIAREEAARGRERIFAWWR